MIYKTALDTVKREIAVMKKINHPNLIKLHEVIENPDNDKIYLVLDFCEQGQLIEWNENKNKYSLKSQISHSQIYEPDKDFINEEELKRIFRDCIKGLHYRKLFLPSPTHSAAQEHVRT